MPAPVIPAEIFFLDRTSGRSLQAQIRETVVASILSHRSLPGARMPSSRKLAAHLGVARMTVTLAFQELVAQGYLAVSNRSAYVVSQNAPVERIGEAQPPADGARGADWGAIMNSRLRLRRQITKPYDWRSFRYPFIYGQMDATLFDHGAWRDCARQALGQRDFDGLASDALAADDPLLVNYIRSRSLPRRGISVESSQILVTLGAQHALWLAIELLTRRPLHAVCENPGYPDTVAALRWCGARVTALDVDKHGLPPDRLPPDTGAVFVTPSHHAPTGATMPMARRKELLAAADAQNFVIVEDDYDFEMSFLEPASRALKAFDRHDRVVYVGSFSKSLFPGLRLGYLVGPEPLIDEARHLRAIMLRHPPGHLQRTAAYFLALGHYDRLVRDMRQRYARRRAVLEQALGAAGIEIAGAATFGGSNVWVKGPSGLDSRHLAELLRGDSVLIEPGGPFFDNNEHPTEYFRLGYSSIQAKLIADGVARIAARVDEALTAVRSTNRRHNA